MSIITIDGKEYNLDSLSDEAKAQIISFPFGPSSSGRFSFQAAASIAYSNELQKHSEAFLGDTMKII